jgi:hypothetical protein
MPEGGVTVAVEDHTAEFLKKLQELAKMQVLVGIPEEKDARQDGTAGNALIGAVMEFGSPAKNIPARPWLVPGVENGTPQALVALESAAQAGLKGDAAGLDRGLNAAGLILQNSVRAQISSNIPPPLAPATIAARRRRFKATGYRRQATSAADTTTLVDTGQLRASITYVISKT